jgi:hypothetical protein
MYREMFRACSLSRRRIALAISDIAPFFDWQLGK